MGEMNVRYTSSVCLSLSFGRADTSIELYLYIHVHTHATAPCQQHGSNIWVGTPVYAHSAIHTHGTSMAPAWHQHGTSRGSIQDLCPPQTCARVLAGRPRLSSAGAGPTTKTTRTRSCCVTRRTRASAQGTACRCSLPSSRVVHCENIRCRDSTG
eukprot:365142-Chlamydomonas_euryale.AAC.5